jgi:hypothetical protein
VGSAHPTIGYLLTSISKNVQSIMKSIDSYINFPLAAQIQRYLDELTPDRKIALAFAIGQKALDDKRSACVEHSGKSMTNVVLPIVSKPSPR